MIEPESFNAKTELMKAILINAEKFQKKTSNGFRPVIKMGYKLFTFLFDWKDENYTILQNSYDKNGFLVRGWYGYDIVVYGPGYNLKDWEYRLAEKEENG